MNNNEEIPRKFISRRKFLRWSLGAGGALVLGAAGSLANAERQRRLALESNAEPLAEALAVPGSPYVQPSSQSTIRLGATDGYMRLPASPADYPGGVRELYVFGFVDFGNTAVSINEFINTYKGQVQQTAPIIDVMEGDEVFVTLTNLGLVVRPDLDDAHTIHWHGFRNPVAAFDGVPETSISVPVGRNFPYYYKPLNPGTFMYHCHFEDTEHVQMGMDGIVFVRPLQNLGTGSLPPGQYLYNDGDGSTAYDREHALLLNEIDTRPHDLLENVQEFVWSDYDPNYFVINGRAYPDTIKQSTDPDLPRQPVSSLIQANPGDRVAIRMSNLGYQQHTMQLAGIPLHIFGHDAALLRNGTVDLSYFTNNVYIGPGESRDMIFEAPLFDSAAETGTDSIGTYNVYWFKNRNYQKLTNDGLPGLGGMMTEVRIYDGSPLPPQSVPNETYA